MQFENKSEELHDAKLEETEDPLSIENGKEISSRVMHFSTIEEVKIKQDLDNMDNIDFISADDFIFIVSVKVFVQPKEKKKF